MQGDRKFHELSEYIIIFQKLRYYDNDILKIQTPIYFFQEYICRVRIVKKKRKIIFTGESLYISV